MPPKTLDVNIDDRERKPDCILRGNVLLIYKTIINTDWKGKRIKRRNEIKKDGTCRWYIFW